MLSLLLALSVVLLVLAVAHDQVAYAPLRRAIREGRLDPTTSDSPRVWTGKGMGTHPEATYRYWPYELTEGEILVLHGQVDPDLVYHSITLYDRRLQSVPSTGPTFLTGEALPREVDGGYTLTLSWKDPGCRPWLDVSRCPKGVVFERQLLRASHTGDAESFNRVRREAF